jgi:hypothetical protein
MESGEANEARFKKELEKDLPNVDLEAKDLLE